VKLKQIAGYGVATASNRLKVGTGGTYANNSFFRHLFFLTAEWSKTIFSCDGARKLDFEETELSFLAI